MYAGDEQSNSPDELETTEEFKETEEALEEEEAEERDETPRTGEYRDSQGFTAYERQNIEDAGRGHLLR